MLSLRTAAVLIAVAALMVHRAKACEESSGATSDFKRVGDIGVSFLVGNRFIARQYDADHGEIFEWAADSAAVTYHRTFNRNWRSIDEHGEEFCSVRLRSKNVKVNFSSDSADLTLKVRPPESYGYEGLSISAASKSEACQLAKSVLDSFRHVNTLDGLNILHVAPDESYFVVENEFGELRAAKIGDGVTRNWGRVVNISAGAIEFLEVRPGPKGGLVEVPVSLTWRRRH